MDRTDEPSPEVARLWQEHRAAEFPDSLRGLVLDDDVDLVLLDTLTAGCVSAWLHDGGQLDEERHQILRTLRSQLERVVPLITDPYGIRYFERLDALALLISIDMQRAAQATLSADGTRDELRDNHPERP